MKTATPKLFEKALAELGLKTLGLDRAHLLIDSAKEAGDIDRVTACRMKRNLRELEADKAVTDSSLLIEELDDKVRGIARYAR